MLDPKDDGFTPGKFIPRNSDEPVGWVTISADIKRDPALKPQRAVVITERDVETLKTIREFIFTSNSALGDDGEQIALLDRLIGQ